MNNQLVAAGGKRQLVPPVRGGIGVDPDEKPIGYAHAESKLLFGRFGQNSIDYVDVTKLTRRHKKQRAPLLQ
ncbi:hypothetical protein D3C80_2131040 [compost metagenome]